MNKKGYMKTVEAVVALILVLGVVVTIVNRNTIDINPTPTEIKIMQDSINNLIENDKFLRRAVLNNQTDKINDTIKQFIPENSTLKYAFLICGTNYCPSVENLPKDKSIYVSNLIISSVYNETGHGVFKLYLWRKLE